METFPITAERALDRRVRRTHLALQEALLALLAERGWDAIDVLALCERADIGRSTFYLHFAGKEDLLNTSLAGLRSMLLALHEDGDPLAFLGGLLAHVQENQQVFRALVGRRSGLVVQERFKAVLLDLLAQALPQSTSEREPWTAEAQARFLAGALFELIAWWLGSTQARSRSEVEELFRAMVAGGVPGLAASQDRQ